MPQRLFTILLLAAWLAVSLFSQVAPNGVQKGAVKRAGRYFDEDSMDLKL